MDVTIEDDSLLEIDEVFRATLGLVNSDDSSRVTLSPAEASVTIFDDDGGCDRYTLRSLLLVGIKFSAFSDFQFFANISTRENY